MIVIADYNKSYIQLKKRIKDLKRQLSAKKLTKRTIDLTEKLNTVATELDIRYMDGLNLEIVEINLESVESILK